MPQFLNPKLSGMRFNGHTLPVDVAGDFFALERMVVDLAKHLYLREHTNRRRVPKGFDRDFQIHLDRIDDGSAIACLSFMLATASVATQGNDSYFLRSRDLIVQCISGVNGAIPQEVPDSVLKQFNDFGKSLRDGESMAIPRQGANDVVYTKAIRESILSRLEVPTREGPVTVLGTIEAVDFTNFTFRVKTDGGLITVPMGESMRGDVRTHVGRTRNRVKISGLGVIDGFNRVKKVLSTEAFEVSQNYEIALRLDALAELENGWFEGSGASLPVEPLAEVKAVLVASFPERLPLPLLFPTPEGNLLLEWPVAGDPSLEVFLNERRAEFHAFVGEEEVVIDFEVADASGWHALLERVRGYL